MIPDLPCPRCGGDLLPDILREAELCCLMCSRRYNLVERRLEPAQLDFLSFHGGAPRRRREGQPRYKPPA